MSLDEIAKLEADLKHMEEQAETIFLDYPWYQEMLDKHRWQLNKLKESCKKS